ncbi:FhaA domain-containing protein [Ornithinimicrobium kibberense]|uniref:FhaA domain-containing protein n=1 Tax=Ornithinimicrobium kibberense TaxID=282060 RepID=A0ABV5V1K3_9MICO|nr:DUF3662 and FHA domain-containing protein [Ornithinimicrobium kibberense]
MGVFDRLERGLERAVKQPFARVFKAEVQPVEIASAMRGAMDDRAAVLGPGRTMVPNVFTIELAESDHERLSSYERALTDELVAAAEDHADAQRYVAPGPFEVRLVAGEDLETGIFRVRPAAKDGRAGARGEDRGRSAPSPDQGYAAASAGPSTAPRRPGGEGRDDARDAGRDESRDEGRTAQFSHEPAPAPSRPARPRRPRPSLEVDGRRIPLTAAVTTLGRDQTTADVVLDDPGVSRRHAEVRITHDGPHLQVVLRDLGSTNGTYLNGDQVGSEELRDGDRMTMGRSTVVFRLEG